MIRTAGGFLAGAITALGAVLAAQRLPATGQALLGMFGAGAALMAVLCVIVAAPWAASLQEDDDGRTKHVGQNNQGGAENGQC